MCHEDHVGQGRYKDHSATLSALSEASNLLNTNYRAHKNRKHGALTFCLSFINCLKLNLGTEHTVGAVQHLMSKSIQSAEK